jgi:putative membrane protein
MSMLLHLVLLSLAIYVVADILPGIRLKGLGTALLVAVVYSMVNVLLGGVLRIVTFPLILLTLGLFLLVINSLMLWVTDLIVEDFEIRDAGTTFVAALFITLADCAIEWII